MNNFGKKLVVAILLGLAGFWYSRFSLSFNNPPFAITITWSYFLPLLAGMAYGPFYGLIAGTVGLGAFFPFLLYPNNGWACLVNSIAMAAWFTWYGYTEEKRRTHPSFWNHPLLTYLPFAAFFILFMRLLFPIAFSLNPPFWYPQAARSMPGSILDGVITKGLLIMYLVVIFDVCILRIPTIRKLFALETKKESRKNGWIVLSAVSGSIFLWFVSIIFNRIFIDKTFPHALFQVQDPHETLALVVFLAAGFFMGFITCQYVESRLKAEDESRRSTESYRLIFEQAADGIFIADENGQFVDVNESGCLLIGFTHAEIMRFNTRDLMMLEGIPNSLEPLQEITASGTRIFERCMRHKNGSPIDVEISASRLADGRLQALVHNISERKRAEQALHESVVRFQSLLDNSPISHWEEDYSAVHARLEELRGSGVTDFDAYLRQHPEIAAECAAQVIILDVNKATLDMFGVKEKAGMVKNLTAIFTEEGLQAFCQQMIQIASGANHFEIETIYKTLDGRRITVNMNWAVIPGFERDLSRTIVSLSDITARKQAEAKIIFQATLLDSVGQAVIATDLSGTIIYINHAAEALYGWPAEEAVGRNIVGVTVPIIAKSQAEEIAAALAQGAAWSGEYYMQHRGGTIFPAGVSEAPVQDDRGKLIGMIGVSTDITERKQAEEEINTTSAELQRLLEEADHSRKVLLNVVEDQKIAEEKLNQLNEELEQRVRARTLQLGAANLELEAFAYSVSHDLRAPLRGIDGWSAALLEDFKESLDEKGRLSLTRIRSETHRMGQMIDDILRLSRITRVEMKHETVSLSNLAQTIAARLQEEDGQRQVQFIIQPHLTEVGDPNLLEIMLTNLLSNAWKFTSKVNQPVIEFCKTIIAGEEVYFVRDNGAGFDMAYAKKLFGAFQRMHNQSDFPGTGIGLATVQRIIHRHGGKVWAEAEKNLGATFYFKFQEKG